MIDSRHFDTFLLLELAKVLLESLAVIIDINLVADRLHRVRICLVHFADWAIIMGIEESRARFGHEDCVSPRALVSLNS